MQEVPPFVAPLFYQPQEPFFDPTTVPPSLSISQPGDVQEQEADAVAERVTASEPANADAAAPVQSGTGFQLQPGLRNRLESDLGSDFSAVRLHIDNQAAQMSRALNAQAFTQGNDIYFDEGKYAPSAPAGKKLLVHELAHVAQQQHQSHSRIDRKVSDADVEADFQAWATKQSRKINKAGPDYPQDLWDYVYTVIFDPATYMPFTKPAKASDEPEWKKKFEKAEVVARWLINLKNSSQSTSVQGQADSRAFGVLDALAQAGFVGQAMTQSGGLSAANKKLLFETVLKTPSSASPTDLETIVKSQCAGVADPASVPIVQTLIDGNASPLKSLDAARTKSILKVLIQEYNDKEEIIQAIAQVLMFNPTLRVAVSDAMMKSIIGTPQLLFKVLKHPYFVEPGYEGAELLQTLIPVGKSASDYNTERMTNDMPWVYTYKQKYYVQYLIDLAKAQGITIPAPAQFNTATLKAWLEANTEKIAQAAGKAFPTTPTAVFEIYRNIADIFFFHIPHDRDVAPDLKGKISHLVPGDPSRQRFEADCDVFATYAMRLFANASFEPIGYLAIVPTGADSARAAHVAALMRQNGHYYIINNKNILDPTLTEAKANDKKTDAIKKLKSMALADAYGSPYPTSMDIFYEDAGAKGEMSQAFKDQDTKLLRTDIK